MYINEFNKDNFQQLLDSYHTALSKPFTSPIRTVEKAGDGNMNFTYRLFFQSGESVIIKQAPPFCAKFPDIAAPQQRIGTESYFYQLVLAHSSLEQFFPNTIHYDETQHVLLMEDLGNTNDFTALYQGEQLQEKDATQLVTALTAIHSIELDTPIENSGMKALNHAHIFDIPLTRHNGLDLNGITSGLESEANKLIGDAKYKGLVHDLGKVYLSSGKRLLHGDFYPGSWLACKNNVAIIDPEFCFSGAVEFDLGVMLAHLVLSEQNNQLINSVVKAFSPQQRFDLNLALMFCGTEIMRRLIGYAQLPLPDTIQKKKQWLEMSMELVRHPKTIW